jgi:hypothetical protein
VTAVAAPIPEEAPVTSATLPVSSMNRCIRLLLAAALLNSKLTTIDALDRGGC